MWHMALWIQKSGKIMDFWGDISASLNMKHFGQQEVVSNFKVVLKNNASNWNTGYLSWNRPPLLFPTSSSKSLRCWLFLAHISFTCLVVLLDVSKASPVLPLGKVPKHPNYNPCIWGTDPPDHRTHCSIRRYPGDLAEPMRTPTIGLQNTRFFYPWWRHRGN